MDYGMWTLIRLRNECRNRNARISGEKAQLVERPETYDRNQNFTKQDYVSPSFEMEIPESTLYKDLHGDVNIPSISLNSLQTYLKTADKTMDNCQKFIYSFLCVFVLQTRGYLYCDDMLQINTYLAFLHLR